MSKVFPVASRLGLGCASLGSRIGGKAGQKALAAAFDRGVNWFDLAPSYGDGQAETLFASFVRGKRDRIHICTKCGIEPPRISALAKLIRPIGRALVANAPGLRKYASRGRAAAQAGALTATSIRESVNRSLKRLGTDYVDVLALHDPDIGELSNEEILRELDDIVKTGKARAVGVAGGLIVAEESARTGAPWTHLQFPDGPGSNAVERLQSIVGDILDRTSIVTYAVFGNLSLDRNQREAESLLVSAGYEMPLEKAVRAAALDRALLRNPKGTVLVSMFTQDHLEFAVSRLSRIDNAQPEAFFRLLGPHLRNEFVSHS